MNTDNGDTTKPMTPADLERLSQLLSIAGDLACQQIGDEAGAKFLRDLLADPAGEILVTVSLKAAHARIDVNWPQFHEGAMTVRELRGSRNRGRAQ